MAFIETVPIRVTNDVGQHDNAAKALDLDTVGRSIVASLPSKEKQCSPCEQRHDLRALRQHHGRAVGGVDKRARIEVDTSGKLIHVGSTAADTGLMPSTQLEAPSRPCGR